MKRNDKRERAEERQIRNIKREKQTKADTRELRLFLFINNGGTDPQRAA